MVRRRVLLLFGGRSAEHDVSRATAVAVARALDPERYEIVPVAITTDGEWLLADAARAAIEAGPASLPAEFLVDGRPAEGLGELVALVRRIVRRSTSTWCCRSSTGRTARTAPCRGCSSWPTSRTSAPASSALPSRWTR